MPKDKVVNPATAHLKSEKAKALKKGKAQLAQTRQSKLAARNPVRLERDIESLREREQASGCLSKQDAVRLADLEKTLGAVKKARDKTGYQHEDRRGNERGDNSGVVLGKRGRGDQDGTRRERSRTPEELRIIPWPRDESPEVEEEFQYKSSRPLEESGRAQKHDLPEKPQGQTVYSSEPVVRDLRKEAVRFVPGVVRGKVKAAKGEGALLDEAQMDELERSGYRRKADGGDGLDEEERKFREEIGAEEGNKMEAKVEDASDEDG
ncbi:MAG: hypothetical protein M1814_000340 [Vezdaea aestivalis]|nr:MAG: hypothetical protein M1814_000340 [Vezdaea aestivalis]